MILQRFLDEPGHLEVRARFCRMLPIAIGAFDLEEVHIFDRLGVAQDVVLATSDVTAKEISKPTATFTDIQHDLR